MSLTDSAIRKAKPTTKTLRMFDGGGLYLELSLAGGKWWRLKYRVNGKEKRLSLGIYQPALSVKKGFSVGIVAPLRQLTPSTSIRLSK